MHNIDQFFSLISSHCIPQSWLPTIFAIPLVWGQLKSSSKRERWRNLVFLRRWRCIWIKFVSLPNPVTIGVNNPSIIQLYLCHAKQSGLCQEDTQIGHNSQDFIGVFDFEDYDKELKQVLSQIATKCIKVVHECDVRVHGGYFFGKNALHWYCWLSGVAF
jgi:hypothetical protein